MKEQSFMWRKAQIIEVKVIQLLRWLQIYVALVMIETQMASFAILTVHTYLPTTWVKELVLYMWGKEAEQDTFENQLITFFLIIFGSNLHAAFPEVFCPDPELETKDRTLGKFLRVFPHIWALASHIWLFLASAWVVTEHVDVSHLKRSVDSVIAGTLIYDDSQSIIYSGNGRRLCSKMIFLFIIINAWRNQSGQQA